MITVCKAYKDNDLLAESWISEDNENRILSMLCIHRSMFKHLPATFLLDIVKANPVDTSSLTLTDWKILQSYGIENKNDLDKVAMICYTDQKNISKGLEAIRSFFEANKDSIKEECE